MRQGLGEKEIAFVDLEMSSEELRELLYEDFPTELYHALSATQNIKQGVKREAEMDDSREKKRNGLGGTIVPRYVM